jgi:hypothetical protein
MSASETATATKTATTVEQLVAATRDSAIRQIVVHGDWANTPSIRLSPGQTLRGENAGSRITFAAGSSLATLDSVGVP